MLWLNFQGTTEPLQAFFDAAHGRKSAAKLVHRNCVFWIIMDDLPPDVRGLFELLFAFQPRSVISRDFSLSFEIDASSGAF